MDFSFQKLRGDERQYATFAAIGNSALFQRISAAGA
jgi:hypothetical protein